MDLFMDSSFFSILIGDDYDFFFVCLNHFGSPWHRDNKLEKKRSNSHQIFEENQGKNAYCDKSEKMTFPFVCYMHIEYNI